MKPMHKFGVFEAKNRFGHLLDLVEHGEEVTISRHGKEVARLIPARHDVDRDEARAPSSVSAPVRSRLSSVTSTGQSGKPARTKAVREPGPR
jgi:prevent-host-death family protein